MIKKYRFKYDNQDKGDFLNSLRFMADAKRLEAEKLRREAEAIDEVRMKLDLDLIEAPRGKKG